jgi:hypothetical protein
MSNAFKRLTPKFVIATAVLIVAPLVHAAGTNVLTPNAAYEEFSGTHETAKMKISGPAGKPGELGEPGRAGIKRDTKAPKNVFDIKDDVPDACRKYLRCSGY